MIGLLASIDKGQKRSSMFKNRDNNIKAWLFLAPHLLIFTIFFLIPVVFGIYISFTDWDLFSSPTFVGLDNYKELFFNSDSTFYEQLRIGLTNTFKFVLLSVPFCIIVPLMLAAALNTKPKLVKIFQSIFYIPSLFAISAVVIIWTLIFNVNYGPVNNLFDTDVPWMATQPYAVGHTSSGNSVVDDWWQYDYLSSGFEWDIKGFL